MQYQIALCLVHALLCLSFGCLCRLHWIGYGRPAPVSVLPDRLDVYF